MANEQFPMYRVVPASGWNISPNTGISGRQIATLTTFMRETLVDAMQEAITDAMARSSLNSRKGVMVRSMRSGMRSTGSGVPSTVSVTFLFRPWMAIHETGGTIKPRNKKYLALPLPDAIRADGGMKRRNPNGWRRHGSFVITSRKGNKFVVYRRGGKGDLIFLYLLVDKVTLSKRLDLYGSIMAKENEVVQQWTNGVMEIFNSIDLYGMAFEGVKVT